MIKSQQQMVSTYMSKNPKRKLTTEQITNFVNTRNGLKGRHKLTPAQVAVCLSRLYTNNFVTKFYSAGTSTEGRKVSLWRFNQPVKNS